MCGSSWIGWWGCCSPGCTIISSTSVPPHRLRGSFSASVHNLSSWSPCHLLPLHVGSLTALHPTTYPGSNIPKLDSLSIPSASICLIVLLTILPRLSFWHSFSRGTHLCWVILKWLLSTWGARWLQVRCLDPVPSTPANAIHCNTVGLVPTGRDSGQ